jgi:hypothetical protein
MVDHSAEPTIPAVSAPQQNGFKVRESWSDRLVVLSVCDVVDMLSAPRMSEAGLTV